MLHTMSVYSIQCTKTYYTTKVTDCELLLTCEGRQGGHAIIILHCINQSGSIYNNYHLLPNCSKLSVREGVELPDGVRDGSCRGVVALELLCLGV